jgi:hypothetical protein
VRLKSIISYIFTIFLIFASLVSVGLTGYYLGRYLISPLPGCNDNCPNNDEEKNEVGNDEFTNDEFYNNKEANFYINDTIYIIPKNNNNFALVGTVARIKNNNEEFIQSTKVSIYDGKRWTRNVESNYTNSLRIANNDTIRSWDLKINSGLSLLQEASGELNIGEITIKFQTGLIKNEMPLRATPEYTKFISLSNGKINVNGKLEDAYIVYSKIYSNYPDKILIYDDDFPFNTYWVSFWGDDGSFYFADITKVFAEVDNYKSHEIGYKVDPTGNVQSVLTINPIKMNQGYSDYKFIFKEDVNETLQIKAISYFDKYEKRSYPWILGLAQGTIQKENGKIVNGKAIFEYIENLSNH